MGVLNRCKYCGSFLKFYVYDDYGRAIYLCNASLTAMSESLEPIMVQCNKLYHEGKELKRISVDGAWISL